MSLAPAAPPGKPRCCLRAGERRQDWHSCREFIHMGGEDQHLLLEWKNQSSVACAVHNPWPQNLPLCCHALHALGVCICAVGYACTQERSRASQNALKLCKACSALYA